MTLLSNIGLRITAILLIGFVLLQALLWAVWAWPAGEEARRPYSLPLPAEVRVLAETIEEAPERRRALLLGTLGGSLYTLRIAAQPRRPQGETGAAADRLRALYARALPGREVVVAARRPLLGPAARPRPRLFRSVSPVNLSVSLRDGSFLIVSTRPSPVVRAYLRQRAMTGVLLGLALLVVLLWAVRRTTRPLARLSDGVRRFGGQLDAPDLPADGPREVRDLASAFNEMKGTIRDLVGERTRMLAGVAHDLRTYLTRLRLRAEFIGDSAQLEKAIADLDEMAALVDDTLLFARQDGVPDPAEPIDLAAELSAIAAVRREMGEKVVLAPVPAGLAVQAAPLALRRMLANLLDNGLRHGSEVRIEASASGAEAQICVADDGPGVPADALARLGEPYGRVDPSRDRQSGGAGLGLAIVKALAARNGGSVAFSNAPAGGFIARIRLPRLLA